MRSMALALALAAATAGGGEAGGVATESARLGTSRVTLHVHPFLTGQELTALRLVMTNEEALKAFVPVAGSYAAMAVSPDDGFIRNGAPVASAVAMAGLPDAAGAASAALAACDAARKAAAACVVVLEVAPTKD
ncbi:hypothetical protein LHP98_03435 [Rhodobacter sp. Har01]|uniref:hypothetical protein n=1 Tax=Rhodobacter sp. Har01 TaxID=2883999 RepID=UPI001D08836C|nr:hypothetical protein [Rhodobacter sp. Har01]MCB6177182.1 hypothetical protein [Rhodobacter sp. Har01]